MYGLRDLGFRGLGLRAKDHGCCMRDYMGILWKNDGPCRKVLGGSGCRPGLVVA